MVFDHDGPSRSRRGAIALAAAAGCGVAVHRDAVLARGTVTATYDR
jgi:hypothetical protein